jgi:hypothetical protein
MRYSRDEYNNKMRRRILFALGASASSARRGWEILFPRRPFLDKVSRSPRHFVSRRSSFIHPSVWRRRTAGFARSIGCTRKQAAPTCVGVALLVLMASHYVLVARGGAQVVSTALSTQILGWQTTDACARLLRTADRTKRCLHLQRECKPPARRCGAVGVPENRHFLHPLPVHGF